MARRESPGLTVAFVFMPVALDGSLPAVLLLRTGMMPTLPAPTRCLHVGLAVAGVGAAWALLHTVFTLRYAHLYYNTKVESCWCSARRPTLCRRRAPAADVAITRPYQRRVALLHGLLSFAFNTAVVALSISGLVGAL